MIAFAAALYGETLHIKETLEYLFEQCIPTMLEQDNEAVIKIIQNKCSARLRHCNRVHKVNIASICETLESESSLKLRYCKSSEQLANAFTKILAPIHWQEALRQLCVRPGDDLRRRSLGNHWSNICFKLKLYIGLHGIHSRGRKQIPRKMHP